MGTSNLEIAFKQRSGRWFLLLPWLAACTSDTVDLGGAEATEGLGRGSRCTDSAVIGEAVLATNQAELDALAGCEEITGDLVVDVFDGADLRPLASLRAVGGTFTLGAYPRPEGSEFWDFYQSRALKEQVDQIVAAGYLPSLEGVEALPGLDQRLLHGVVGVHRRAEHAIAVTGERDSVRLELGELRRRWRTWR